MKTVTWRRIDMSYTIVEKGNWQLAINPVSTLKKAEKELKKLKKANPKKIYWIGTL